VVCDDYKIIGEKDYGNFSDPFFACSTNKFLEREYRQQSRETRNGLWGIEQTMIGGTYDV